MSILEGMFYFLCCYVSYNIEFAYKLIMEKYNDFLIADSDKMESIAREYQRALKDRHLNQRNKAHKKTLGQIECYEDLKKQIAEINFAISNIHKFCNAKFYNSKKTYIEDILCKIKKLPMNNIKSEPQFNNYCMIVDYCIKKIANAIQSAMQALKEVSGEDYENVFNIVVQLSNILPTVSCLIGVCRYRW